MRLVVRAIAFAVTIAIASILASVVSTPSAARADCRQEPSRPPVLLRSSRGDAPLPADVAFVFVLDGPEVALPDLVLARGETQIPIAIETLAPGAVLARPRTAPEPGAWRLRTADGAPFPIAVEEIEPDGSVASRAARLPIDVTISAAAAAAGDPLAEASSVRVVDAFVGPSGAVYVVLDGELDPARDLALFLRGPPGERPLRRVDVAGAAFVASDPDAVRCGSAGAALVRLSAGDSVALAVVDRAGRVRAAGDPIVLRASGSDEPPPPRHDVPPPFDPVDPPHTCDPFVIAHEGAAVGVGLELGTGWHSNVRPVEHLALEMGLRLDVLLADFFLLGGRVAYLTGGDAGEDVDRDGDDDRDGPNVHALVATAGPRVRLYTGLGETPTFWEIAFGWGYAGALSDGASRGAVVDGAIEHAFGALRFGARYTGAFREAESFRTVLFHAALVIGAIPDRSWGAGCGQEPPDSEEGPFGLAVGLEFPAIGFGVSGDLGYMPPGFAFYLGVRLFSPIDLVFTVDHLWFAGAGREALTVQTVSAGVRVVAPETLLAIFTGSIGYGLAHGLRPSSIEDGPVADLGIAYDLVGESGGALFGGVHYRFGLADANEALRAIYLTVGGEMRTSGYR